MIIIVMIDVTNNHGTGIVFLVCGWCSTPVAQYFQVSGTVSPITCIGDFT